MHSGGPAEAGARRRHANVQLHDRMLMQLRCLQPSASSNSEQTLPSVQSWVV